MKVTANLKQRYSTVSRVGSANQKIDIFKITCKVLFCVGVGLIKKTLMWQQIPCIPCSGNIKKYLEIEPFLAVAFCNLVHFSQLSFSRFMSIFPLTQRHK